MKTQRDSIPVLLSWSGGKDSSLCLYEMRTGDDFRSFAVEGLLTTLTRDYNRVSMHGVRRELLVEQARLVGVPLEEVWIPSNASNETYETEMSKVLSKAAKSGIKCVVFGDLFLSDIREYRERLLGRLGFDCLFPIWKKDTRELAERFIDLGFRAIICTVDPKKLDPKFCGREFDRKFLAEIPAKVDPCGENGEFHTFVYDGPIFNERFHVRLGEVVKRDGFFFADLLSEKEED